MPRFSSQLTPEVRLEHMRPGQLDAAKKKRPAAYVTFGSIEWHGRQNAVGLDTLRAHEMLIQLALTAGGVVFPPLFLGSGGGHTDYPYSYLLDSRHLKVIALQFLQGLDRDGFRSVIMAGGHGPNMDDFVKPAVAEYKENGGAMNVLAFDEWQVPGVTVDHAANWETSMMMYYHPETVDLKEISGAVPAGMAEPEKRWRRTKRLDAPPLSAASLPWNSGD